MVSGVNSGEESAEDLMKVGYKRNVRPPPSALLQVSYRYCSTTKISTLGHTWPGLSGWQRGLAESRLSRRQLDLTLDAVTAKISLELY